MSTTPQFALPGDSLGATNTHTPGPGSHIFGSNIHSSLAGAVTCSAPSKKVNPTLFVSSSSSQPTQATNQTTQTQATQTAAIPSVGDIVLGRITRTTPRQASLSILCLGPTGSTVLHEPFPALIRQQDIRATEIDKVKVSESFRVGDVVRGVVISLGDERSYYVGTAKNEFGVVLATGEGGGVLVPVSWREMRETGSGRVERRKVAKPV